MPETEQAIAELGQLGVPVVATTLTGQGLPSRSPMYFQLVPGNRVQAGLVTEYARAIDRNITVYHPQQTDGYTRALVEEMRKAAGPYGRPARSWRISVNEVPVRCGHDELAFYAGRETQFGQFLSRVAEKCMDNAPMVVGDDTTVRFVAQPDDRDRPALNQLPVSWVDMGSMVVLAGETCRSEGVPARSTSWHPLKAFCAVYKRIHHPGGSLPPAADEYAGILSRSAELPWAGQGVGLSYDAAGLFLHAIQENRNRPAAAGISQRGAIAQELREGTEFAGATGLITFRDRRDGAQRNLAILRIADITDTSAVPACQYLIGVTTNRQNESCPR